METLEIKNLKRDPSKFKNIFKTVGDVVLTTKDIDIVFPERYITRELAVISSSVRLLGIYAILDRSNNYCIVNNSIVQQLAPYIISDVTVNGVVYKKCSFEANTPFLLNNNLIVTDSFLYDIFEEFLSKGNVPWYLDYNDLADIFANTERFNGKSVGNDPIALEILTSVVAKSSVGKDIPYRLVKNKKLVKPEYIGLNDMRFAFDNTGSRLVGSYFSDGITTSIVDPETKTSEQTKILRR